MARADRKWPRYSARGARTERARRRHRDAPVEKQHGSSCAYAVGGLKRVTKTKNEKRKTKNANRRTKNEKRRTQTMAVETETGRFTVGVFQDSAWAEKGVDALRKQGIAVEALSILGKASPEMAAFIERTLGAPQALEVHDLGAAVARGPLVGALQGSDQGLTKA